VVALQAGQVPLSKVLCLDFFDLKNNNIEKIDIKNSNNIPIIVYII
jgi:hypothetical protein